jgi:hypothetical protein
MRRRTLKGAAMVIIIALTPILVSGTSANATKTNGCSHLVVGATEVAGALGTGGMSFLVANLGGRCTVEGYPIVNFFSSHGSEIDRKDLHQSSMLFAEPSPRLITLTHGAVASFGVSWGDNPVGTETIKSCPRTAWANVRLASGIGVFDASPAVNAAPCGGWLIITPLEIGPEPAKN